MTIWMSILLKGLSSSNQHSFSKSHGAKIGSLVLSNHIGHSEFGLINHNWIWLLNWLWLVRFFTFTIRWFRRTWFCQCCERHFFLSFWRQNIYSVTIKKNWNIISRIMETLPCRFLIILIRLIWSFWCSRCFFRLFCFFRFFLQFFCLSFLLFFLLRLHFFLSLLRFLSIIK